MDAADYYETLEISSDASADEVQRAYRKLARKTHPDLTIPANARAGQKLRLKGKGLPGHPAGHLFALLQIANPDATGDAARELFKKLARDMPFDPRKNLERSR